MSELVSTDMFENTLKKKKVKNHITFIRMTKIKKAVAPKVGEDMKQLEYFVIQCWGKKKGTATLETCLAVSNEIKQLPALWLSSSTP